MPRRPTSEFTKPVTVALKLVQLLSLIWTVSLARAWLMSALVQQERNRPFTGTSSAQTWLLFAKAFGEAFKDGADRSIYLGENTLSGFELVSSRSQHYMQTLAECFIQAEKLVFPDQIKTEALDNVIRRRQMVKKPSKPMPLKRPGRVIDSVPDGMPFRTLIVDCVCSEFETRDKSMDYMVKELEWKDSSYGIMAFLWVLKGLCRDTSKSYFGLLYDPTMERCQNPSTVSVEDMPGYQTGFLKRKAPLPVVENGDLLALSDS